VKALLDWLDSRSGYRRLLHKVLYEELPSGTAWLFTTGSVVTLLIACQFITGLGLTMYYVPSPRLAFDSVRFIMSDLPLGWMLRVPPPAVALLTAALMWFAARARWASVFFTTTKRAPAARSRRRSSVRRRTSRPLKSVT